MENETGVRYYCCCKCRTFICLHNDILQRTFQGPHGRAYLFTHVKNINLGPQKESMMITGMHTVSDVFCKECGEVLGWKYFRAEDDVNEYKVGKFVIEKFKVDLETW